MKKKIMAAALCMLTLTVFTACGKKDTSDLVYMKDFDPEKFVTLGDYQNVEIALDEPSVSEEYLESSAIIPIYDVIYINTSLTFWFYALD